MFNSAEFHVVVLCQLCPPLAMSWCVPFAQLVLRPIANELYDVHWHSCILAPHTNRRNINFHKNHFPQMMVHMVNNSLFKHLMVFLFSFDFEGKLRNTIVSWSHGLTGSYKGYYTRSYAKMSTNTSIASVLIGSLQSNRRF